MRRDKIIVQPGEMPPEVMTVEGVHFTFHSTHYNKIDKVRHYVYRSASGWLISFTDRQFAVGVDVDPNRKSDWWAGDDFIRSEAAKRKAAKSVPNTITSPAWSERPKKTKRKEAEKPMKRSKRAPYKQRKVKSEDLFK